MTRIQPVKKDEITSEIQVAFEKHVARYQARITNMKATLARSLPAFDVYMQWYVLYDELKQLLGSRMASLYAYAVSYASECPLCSTFFRKIIIENGENPESLVLNDREQTILAFGSEISKNRGHITNETFNSVKQYFRDEEMVLLIGFAGQMIATNIFSNATETDIDDYLLGYFKPVKADK